MWQPPPSVTIRPSSHNSLTLLSVMLVSKKVVYYPRCSKPNRPQKKVSQRSKNSYCSRTSTSYSQTSLTSTLNSASFFRSLKCQSSWQLQTQLSYPPISFPFSTKLSLQTSKSVATPSISHLNWTSLLSQCSSSFLNPLYLTCSKTTKLTFFLWTIPKSASWPNSAFAPTQILIKSHRLCNKFCTIVPKMAWQLYLIEYSFPRIWLVASIQWSKQKPERQL